MVSLLGVPSDFGRLRDFFRLRLLRIGATSWLLAAAMTGIQPGEALAQCSALNATVNCSDNAGTSISYDSPVNVLNVSGLTANVTGISLIRQGAQPAEPSSGLYACSGQCNLVNNIILPTCSAQTGASCQTSDDITVTTYSCSIDGKCTITDNSSQSATCTAGDGASCVAVEHSVPQYTCSISGRCTITTDIQFPTCSPKDADSSCDQVAVSQGATGNAGPSVTVNYTQTNPGKTNPGAVINTGQGAGVVAQSQGSRGGNGGNSYVAGNAGNGRAGADGGSAAVVAKGYVETWGNNSPGVAAESAGGRGGNGGSAYVAGGSAGRGGLGGNGGTASVSLLAGSTVITTGDYSPGVAAVSQGGSGGNGGGGGGIVFSPGGGNGAGTGGFATVTIEAGTSIRTSGQNSHGVLAQSLGGGGGSSAGGFGLLASLPAGGGTGGDGGEVQIDTNGVIETRGDYAQGILAQSIGGGGGDGSRGDSLIAGLGGSGAQGGSGGKVNVTNTGSIVTEGLGSNAIEAQSIGGSGGNGGGGTALVSLGGSGSDTSTGGAVTVTNTGALATHGGQANGILAQSIGGGGGNGGSAGGLFSAGGSGGDGADGAKVAVFNGGDITTGIGLTPGSGDDKNSSSGIMAQSIGGGGGNGGGSIAMNAGASVALGGSGGNGGIGGEVEVLVAANSTSYDISTTGDYGNAILAQSVGGGGGNGGFAVSAGAGNFSFAFGGDGGDGGAASSVTVETPQGLLQTNGLSSNGILAQSVGGGGGNGGFAISASASESLTVTLGSGGDGGSGGDAGVVTVDSLSNIFTRQDSSNGIVAQSIGGGGGNGGFSISAAGSGISLAAAVGGDGGEGGTASAVSVTTTGYIATLGDNSNGVLAQSIGGSGGNGGFAGSLALGAAGVSLSLGGEGGAGQDAGNVTVTTHRGELLTNSLGSWSLITHGDNSSGIAAQSIGGGGGNGGLSASLSAGALASVGVTIGGGGAGGGDADQVVINNGDAGSPYNILTKGDVSAGILAQSIGGGGGNGGFAVTLAASGSYGSLGAAVGGGVGGDGGAGGEGKAVTVTSVGDIWTLGSNSDAILAQSIGGGGGNGGFAAAGSVTTGAAAVSVAVGGSGAGGGGAGEVTVGSTGAIFTQGDKSAGIVAQSIGGGGGNGGFAAAVGISLQGGSADVAVGGSGSTGGNAKAVTVTNNGAITTMGSLAQGILAQSIGGGGGNGGAAVTFAASNAFSAGVSIGGAGAGGGKAGSVTVTNTGTISTGGDFSNAIMAQSIGGGGGNGGFAVSGTLAIESGNASVSVGGSGSTGGTGGVVIVESNLGQTLEPDVATLYTQGGDASGIVAQSIGGGGGNGGFAGALSLGVGGAAKALSIAVGGSGGTGQDAESVTVTSNDNILTEGKGASGIVAQSIGGGGGNGGFGAAGSFSSGQMAASVAIGGSGDGGGSGNVVILTSTGAIATGGDYAYGVLAQSVGGGGGNGGLAVTAGVDTSANGYNFGVALGGSGDGGGSAKKVEVTRSGDIATSGYASIGILAQSIGGGGGNGGFAISGEYGGEESKNFTATVGGNGAAGGDAGSVEINSTGDIVTEGNDAYGIAGQSIGGGGGNGGFAISGIVSAAGEELNLNASVTIGGQGAGGGKGSDVTITNSGGIDTSGDGSYGILAQSVGGGGGNGGFAIAGIVSGRYGDNNGKQVNLSAAVGGKGGSGDVGGDVTVYQAGAILTSGEQAHGILAQSIGGGGGNGGHANSISLQLGIPSSNDSVNPACNSEMNSAAGSNCKQSKGAKVQITVGGEGGDGNDGGNVTVTNDGAIITTGLASSGIVAQSIGGGGGNGEHGIIGTGGLLPPMGAKALDAVFKKFSTSSSIQSIGRVSIGGSGGASGDGRKVTVINRDAILTEGDFASGIVAQSIGGGGGNGGDASSGLTGLVSVGGSGGASGKGGAVKVNNEADAVIVTQGLGAYGIFAQSIGGGGGHGGGAAALIAVGGSGGEGGGASGTGGSVTIENDGDIWTFGDSAGGILAQSIGGGGGTGGGVQHAAVAVGGNGGASGDGGSVTVDNTGKIITAGIFSHAIAAQSIGGGGGMADGQSKEVLAQGSVLGFIAVGGNGGAGGDGKAVEITNSNLLKTSGYISHGIFAQSVGGGGGEGGRAVGLIGVGGQAESNGAGGDVTVTNLAAGVIVTEGDQSNGILAMSVGGGGGTAGSAKVLYESDPFGLQHNVGGADSSGDAKIVRVTNEGLIVVSGLFSGGIVAQSIGGGGGNSVVAGSMTFTSTPEDGSSLALGGVGSSGTGGEVTISNSGTIIATGANSLGMFAQSLGGGGGLLGSSLSGLTPAVHIGGQKDETDGGATGDGKDVFINNASPNVVAVSGKNSVAIFAQSVGGGGGLVLPGSGASSFTLNGGGSGRGGNVTITNVGTVYASGDNSIGIFGQSVGGGGGAIGLPTDSPGQSSQTGTFLFAGTAGGSGDSGSVSIDQTGHLFAGGLNSIAIIGQSAAGMAGTPGNITINIHGNDSWIVGGSGAGAGVALLDGRTNTLNNSGIVTTVLGVNGTAISGGVGSETVNNFHYVIGSVDLGEGTNNFNNEHGAVFVSGATINLGAGGLLTNDGDISPGNFPFGNAPGTPGAVYTTNVTGDFIQEANGRYNVDLDLGPQAADRINISGTAQVSGTVLVNILNPGLARPGNHWVTILSAEGGETHPDLSLDHQPSAVVTYSLLYPNGHDINLGFDIDFAPRGMTVNETSVGNAINRIQSARNFPDFVPIAETLFYKPDIPALASAYDALSGEGTSAAQHASFASDTAFSNLLTGRMLGGAEVQPSGACDRRSPDETEEGESTLALPACQSQRWLAWGAGLAEQRSTDGQKAIGSADVSARLYGGAFGFEYRATNSFLAGLAFGGSHSRFAVDSRLTTGAVDGGHIAAYARQNWDGFYTSFAIRAAAFENRTERYITGVGPTEFAKSKFSSASGGARFEIGSRQRIGPVNVTPFAAFDYDKLWQNGHGETTRTLSGEPGQLGLTYDEVSPTSAYSSLGLQIDASLRIDEAVFSPYFRASWLHEFEAERKIRPSFNAAPGEFFDVAGAAAARDAARIEAGFKLDLSPDVSVFSSFQGEFSSRSESYTGTGGLKLRW